MQCLKNPEQQEREWEDYQEYKKHKEAVHAQQKLGAGAGGFGAVPDSGLQLVKVATDGGAVVTTNPVSTP